MEFRLLREGDDHILDVCAPDVFDDPVDLATTREFLADPRHHLAVALDGETVVGFVSAVHYVHPDKPRPELWVNEVGVAPTHQRQGVAKKLLQLMMAEAGRLGCKEAWVLTDRSNGPAMGLYKSVGGVEDPGDLVMFTMYVNRPATSR